MLLCYSEPFEHNGPLELDSQNYVWNQPQDCYTIIGPLCLTTCVQCIWAQLRSWTNVFNNLFTPQSNKKANSHHDTVIRHSLIMSELCVDIQFGYKSSSNIQIRYSFGRYMFFHCQIDLLIAFIPSPRQPLLVWVTMKSNIFCIWLNQAFDLCLTASIQDVGNYKG